jgi:hypothetical protein
MTDLAATTRTASAVRPFHFAVPDEALVDLRRRIAATRWPEREDAPIRALDGEREGGTTG